MFQEIKYEVRRRGARLHELNYWYVATEVDKMTQFLYVPLMGPALFSAWEGFAIANYAGQVGQDWQIFEIITLMQARPKRDFFKCFDIEIYLMIDTFLRDQQVFSRVKYNHD